MNFHAFQSEILDDYIQYLIPAALLPGKESPVHNETEIVCTSGKAIDLILEGPGSNLSWGTETLTEFFSYFVKSLHANSEMVRQIWARPLPYIAFSIHYLVIIFSFDDI